MVGHPIKVLITEGLWNIKTSEQIADLLEQGRTVEEIERAFDS